jgi:hypothetical protein
MTRPLQRWLPDNSAKLQKCLSYKLKSLQPSNTLGYKCSVANFKKQFHTNEMYKHSEDDYSTWHLSRSLSVEGTISHSTKEHRNVSQCLKMVQWSYKGDLIFSVRLSINSKGTFKSLQQLSIPMGKDDISIHSRILLSTGRPVSPIHLNTISIQYQNNIKTISKQFQNNIKKDLKFMLSGGYA